MLRQQVQPLAIFAHNLIPSAIFFRLQGVWKYKTHQYLSMKNAGKNFCHSSGYTTYRDYVHRFLGKRRVLCLAMYLYGNQKKL